jgi:hypothetical protein
MATLHVIAESEKDVLILRTIIAKRYPSVTLRRVGQLAVGGIGRMAKDLKTNIEQALKTCKAGDCIAVIHDLDKLSRPDGRSDYEKVARICAEYAEHVILIQAHDEIESWLLADSGICKWLGQNPQNYDLRLM